MAVTAQARAPQVDATIAELKRLYGDRLTTAHAVREQHGKDISCHEAHLPDAVVFAESAEEVQAIVQLCARHHTPIIAFGTGTSLEGHISAPNGGISLDVSRMNRVLQVNEADLDVVVQPGVTRKQLNEHLRATGLFFPIDPGANASIGGMASTRASGTNAVRYGTMKENVLAVTAGAANGEEIRTARRARKSSAGYDMTRLFVGAEGTLGILTSVTLRLHGIPQKIAGGVCAFPSVKAACDAVIMTIQMGIPVARIELVDALQMRASIAYAGLPYEESPALFLEFHGTDETVALQSAAFAEIAAECGGGEFKWTASPEERTKLWKARHDAYWSVRALAPGLAVLSTDVCVPISRLADCVAETQADIEANGL